MIIFLGFKLSIISSLSLKSWFTRLILILAWSRPLNRNFVGNIFGIILSISIKFGIIWLISVLFIVGTGRTTVRLVIDSIGRFDQIRIVVAICQLIGASMRSFNSYIICLVIVMISRFPFEWNMRLRTTMLALINKFLPHVQI